MDIINVILKTNKAKKIVSKILTKALVSSLGNEDISVEINDFEGVYKEAKLVANVSAKVTLKNDTLLSILDKKIRG